MNLFINGTKADTTLEGEKTMGDVLRSFELTCESSAAAVVGITINGQKVDAESFDSYTEKPLSENTKFEFEVVTKQAVGDSFKKLSSVFSTLSERMEQVPVDLQSGRGKAAGETLTLLADSVQQFCRTAALSSLFPDAYTAVRIEDKPFADFFAELTPVLAQLEQALESNDTILVGDLAEYELCPRLKAVSKALEGFNDI